MMNVKIVPDYTSTLAVAELKIKWYCPIIISTILKNLRLAVVSLLTSSSGMQVGPAFPYIRQWYYSKSGLISPILHLITIPERQNLGRLIETSQAWQITMGTDYSGCTDKNTFQKYNFSFCSLNQTQWCDHSFESSRRDESNEWSHHWVWLREQKEKL